MDCTMKFIVSHMLVLVLFYFAVATKSYTVNSSTFRTGERYEVDKLLGSGAYGQVVRAKDKRNGG